MAILLFGSLGLTGCAHSRHSGALVGAAVGGAIGYVIGNEYDDHKKHDKHYHKYYDSYHAPKKTVYYDPDCE